MIRTLTCLLGFHRPDRRRVAWNGEAYVGTCEGCDRAIRRIRHRRWTLESPPDG